MKFLKFPPKPEVFAVFQVEAEKSFVVISDLWYLFQPKENATENYLGEKQYPFVEISYTFIRKCSLITAIFVICKQNNYFIYVFFGIVFILLLNLTFYKQQICFFGFLNTVDHLLLL